MSKTRKNPVRPPGRPPDSGILDKPTTQEVILLRVRKTGKEAHCFEGIVSERQYRQWKADNPWWKKTVDREIARHFEMQGWRDPQLLKAVRAQWVKRMNEESIGDRDLIALTEILMRLNELAPLTGEVDEPVDYTEEIPNGTAPRIA